MTGATVVAVVAGCVTVPSNVVLIGKDTYQLSMTGVGFATQANTNVKALQEANAYGGQIIHTGIALGREHAMQALAGGGSYFRQLLEAECRIHKIPKYHARRFRFIAQE